MNNSKITFNNITITGINNSLIVGELKISTPAPGAIDIPHQAETIDSNVILQKGDDNNFKNLFNLCPVRPFGIKLYDQCGHLCNKWESNRCDNSSGNVKITSDTKALFSNIEFPKGLSGQTYLVISSYSGFDRCVLKKSKIHLAQIDLDNLSQKSEVSDIILFIADTINSELISLGFDLSQIFKEVHTSPVFNLLNHFTEFIAGKSVAGSRPSFQGMLNFGNGVEIVVARFRSIAEISNIDCQIRRNGRIQINSTNKNCAVKFFIVLKHDSSESIKISEEFTDSKFEVVHYDSQNLPGFTPEHFVTLFEGFSFLEKLNENKDLTTVIEFIKENPVNVVSYIYKSPLYVFESIEADCESSQMIVEYANTLRQQIYNILVTNASKAYSSTNHKVRKNVMFNDSEMHPNYSEPHQLYNGISPCRMTSIASTSLQQTPLYSHGIEYPMSDS